MRKPTDLPCIAAPIRRQRPRTTLARVVACFGKHSRRTAGPEAAMRPLQTLCDWCSFCASNLILTGRRSSVLFRAEQACLAWLAR